MIEEGERDKALPANFSLRHQRSYGCQRRSLAILFRRTF